MRIGMMVDMYKPYISGVTNHIEITSRALSNAGHEVTIFTFGDKIVPDESERVIRSKGLPIKVPFADLTFQFSRNHSRNAENQIKQMDVINVHHPFISGEIAYRYCWDLSIPIIFTSHTRYDLYAEIYTPRFLHNLVLKTLARNLKKACHQFDAVITPSESSREMYRRLGIESNFISLSNGISLSHMHKTYQGIERGKLGLTNDNVIIMYLGRIGPEKNLPLLIDAFHKLHKSKPQTRMVIVGRGTENKKLAQQVKYLGLSNVVVFTGYVPYSEVPKYLQTADIFVTASVTEVNPLSVLEAMAMGLPIVGVDSSGIRDLVEHNCNGLLSEMNAILISKNLAELVDDEESRIQMGTNSKKRVQGHDIETTHKRLIEIFENLIQKKAGIGENK
jgi:glycosyltransferase involved in cell wall biosynthesis